MPLAKLPKFLQRNKSGRRARKDATPVIHESPLSPVMEDHAIPIPLSPVGSELEMARPVPPPQHVHSLGEHHDMHHDDYIDEMHEPQSRLYETFSPSQDGRSVPRVLREGDGDEHLQRHLDDYSDGHAHHPGITDELGFAQTERSGHENPAVFIAPSEQSASSHSSSQKVTFLGNLPSHDRTPSMHRRALSMSAHSRDRRLPVASSSHNYGSSRRHASDYRYPKPPKISRPDRPYEFRRPYLILTDFGHGLEIGNEEDGFMSYEDYCDTAHYRRSRRDTYYVIPGSTSVVFNDEDGHEMYQVDAWKYNTPWLRRKQYIIQDEDGNEMFRVGGSGSTQNSLDGSHSSRSKDRVTYLPSDFGSNMQRRPKYKNKRPARSYNATTPLTRSALFEEDNRTVSSQLSSNPDIVVVNEVGEQIYDSRNSFGGRSPGARSPLTRSQYVTEVSYPSRPDSGFVDERGQPIDRAHSPEYPWGTSGTESTETEDHYEGSRRRSRVFHA